MIRVALVEDQTIMREGLETLLNLTADIHVVGRAATKAEGLEVIAACDPHVILMDVRLPDGTGIEILRFLMTEKREQNIIMLTTFDDDSVLIEALRLGAKGFLLKDVAFETLTSAIRKVSSGENMFGASVSDRLRKALLSIPIEPSVAVQEALSEREVEILRLMTAGMNNSEIADALFISEGTVKNYVSKILAKFGVRDRVRAVLRGIQSGYLS
jgi:DNA-binding NarL/FixJ family response regulator